MASPNDSSLLSDFIDDEVFFGQVTRREKRVRERFEEHLRNNTQSLDVANSSKYACNHVQVKNPNNHGELQETGNKNDESVYESFSVEDSRYDSFEDSLNAVALENKNRPSSEILSGHISNNIKKSFDKVKGRSNRFYDSLEDVCSLASNIEKCSISCEADYNVHAVDQQLISSDSLKSDLPVVLENKCSINEQMQFDDDSLAIVEFEKAFDDSLEDFSVPPCIEEELDILDVCTFESQELVDHKVETSVPKNLFETSVEVIYEKIVTSSENEFLVKEEANLKHEDVSGSECNDFSRDSLEKLQKNFEFRTNEKVCDDSNKVEENIGVFTDNKLLPLQKNIISSHFSNSQGCQLNSVTSSKYCGDDVKTNSYSTDVNRRVEAVLENIKTPLQDNQEMSFPNSQNLLPLNEKLVSGDLNLQLHIEVTIDGKCEVTNSESIKLPAISYKQLLGNEVDFHNPILQAENQKIEKFSLVQQPSISKHLSDNKNSFINQSFIAKSDVTSKSSVVVQPVLHLIDQKTNVDKTHKNEGISKVPGQVLKEVELNNCHSVAENNKSSNTITCRMAETLNTKKSLIKSTDDIHFFSSKQGLPNISLFHALDLHNISSSFRKDTTLQSRDSLMPLNLCIKEANFFKEQSFFRNESKENIPGYTVTNFTSDQTSCKGAQMLTQKNAANKFSKLEKNSNNAKGIPLKKPCATKIPVLKMDCLSTPSHSPKYLDHKKIAKSSEKFKTPIVIKSAPHSASSHKANSDSTKKASHFCMLSNSILCPSSTSKLPKSAKTLSQKKFQNIESPVSRYIRNTRVCSSPKTVQHFLDPMGLAVHEAEAAKGFITPKANKRKNF